MGTGFANSAVTPQLHRSAVLVVGLRLGGLILYTLRWVVFAVLRTLQPLVQITLFLLAIGGFATCLLFKFAVHAPHFPLGIMLSFSVAMAVLSVGYALVAEKLAP